MLTKPYTIATTICLVKNQSFPIKVIEPVIRILLREDSSNLDLQLLARILKQLFMKYN